MYIPKNFLAADKDEIIAFMRRYSFATIVSAKKNIPTATHLPFIVSTNDDNIILTSHFAKANEQWAAIAESKVLVIFNEPHAYISPKHYEKDLNVPTWNYFSVHAYGHGELITDEESTFEILEATITFYEVEYKQQWDSLPEDYKLKMVKGIVAFKIVVTDLQAKKKLSQNKTAAEQERIIKALSKSDNKNEQDIAKYMKQNSNAQ